MNTALPNTEESDERFFSALEKGIKAEDYVQSWLQLNYAYVQDMRHQSIEGNLGPRLYGKSGTLILPDFAIYDRYAGNWAIDVKAKGSVYTIDKIKCFTVDKHKVENYISVAQIMRLDGVKLFFVYDKNMYVYDVNDSHGTHRYNNSFGTDAMLFKYDISRIVR